MLLCRRWFLLHRGMGDCESPMSCLIICLVVAIIPRFPRFDKSFIFWAKIIPVGKPLRHASRASSPFRGAFFDAAPQKPPDSFQRRKGKNRENLKKHLTIPANRI